MSSVSPSCTNAIIQMTQVDHDRPDDSFERQMLVQHLTPYHSRNQYLPETYAFFEGVLAQNFYEPSKGLERSAVGGPSGMGGGATGTIHNHVSRDHTHNTVVPCRTAGSTGTSGSTGTIGSVVFI